MSVGLGLGDYAKDARYGGCVNIIIKEALRLRGSILQNRSSIEVAVFGLFP